MLLVVWELFAPLIVRRPMLGNAHLETLFEIGRCTYLLISTFDLFRDEIVGKMRSSGILIGGCGESSIRFRPALIFEPQHADIMIDKFDEVLSKMK